MVGVDQTVIGRVRLVEHREPARVGFPREAPGIDNRAAERRAVAAEKFGQRMDDDVGAVFDRAQQNRCRHGIVDDQGNAVPPGDGRDGFDVANVSGRIADALAEDRTRLFVDQFFDGFRPIGIGEADADALAWQDVSEQRVCGAVKLRN